MTRRCSLQEAPSCTPVAACTGPARPDVVHMAQEHFTAPEPIVCKWCGSKDVMKYGTRKGVQEYICVTCHRKFRPKDSPAGMRFTVEQIGTALTMYYGGQSLSIIAETLRETQKLHVNPVSVYRWILRYTKAAIAATDPLILKHSTRWAVDETVILVGGKNLWFWDIIDDRSRFLIATHLSRVRTIKDVILVMEQAKRKVGGIAPDAITSDRLAAYDDGIERVFGADSRHIHSFGFTDELNNNLIERFHGAIKQRTKVMRGFKRSETALLILRGFLVNYNYFRPHMGLKGETPAEVAGVQRPFENWLDVVRKA